MAVTCNPWIGSAVAQVPGSLTAAVVPLVEEVGADVIVSVGELRDANRRGSAVVANQGPTPDQGAPKTAG